LINLEVFEEKKLGIARCVDSLTAEDLQGYLGQWGRKGSEGYDELFVATNIDLQVNFSEMLEHANVTVTYNRVVNATGRTAVVVDQEHAEQVAGYYQAVHSIKGDREVQVFTDEAVAREWLGK